ISVTNVGLSTAQSVVVSDSLPAGLRYASAVPSQGTCSESGGRISCSVGDLGVSAKASIAIHATFDFDTLVVVNTATATATNPDANAANNSSTATTLVVTGLAAVGPGDASTAPVPVRAQPNPFRRMSRVFFRAAPGSRAELQIFDAAGRRVRTMVAAASGDGTSMEWDGTGDEGGPVGPGVFFYRVTVN